MKRQILTAVAGCFVLVGSAFADHCPVDMEKIDAALATQPKISAQQLSEIKKLRAEGEVQHKNGQHKESVATLSSALKILNAK